MLNLVSRFELRRTVLRTEDPVQILLENSRHLYLLRKYNLVNLPGRIQIWPNSFRLRVLLVGDDLPEIGDDQIGDMAEVGTSTRGPRDFPPSARAKSTKRILRTDQVGKRPLSNLKIGNCIRR